MDWIVRFIRFHRMRPRDDLLPAEPRIEAFLTHLAVEGDVAPATQNQAMNALVFLYKRVLRQSMEDSINAVRADKKVNVPVVMTRDEVAAVISLLEGTPQLVAKLLYGRGLRIMEAVRLWVKDIDFPMKQLTVTHIPQQGGHGVPSPWMTSVFEFGSERIPRSLLKESLNSGTRGR